MHPEAPQTEPDPKASPGSFADFYLFYLGEHRNRTCRRLHFLGTSLGLACFVMAAWLLKPGLVVLGLLLGYGLAWTGHFAFEKNRPASFKQPLYSFRADWLMWWQMLTRRMPF